MIQLKSVTQDESKCTFCGRAVSYPLKMFVVNTTEGKRIVQVCRRRECRNKVVTEGDPIRFIKNVMGK